MSQQSRSTSIYRVVRLVASTYRVIRAVLTAICSIASRLNGGGSLDVAGGSGSILTRFQIPCGCDDSSDVVQSIYAMCGPWRDDDLISR